MMSDSTNSLRVTLGPKPGAIPLHGMVPISQGTPFTEIDNCGPSWLVQKIDPPELPPRSNTAVAKSSASSQQPPSKQPKSIPLIRFSRSYSDQFPLHVKVTHGHYGTTNMETLSGQEELIVLYEKRQEVLRIQSKSEKVYSIPFGSTIPISILHDPTNDETDAQNGKTYQTLSDFKEMMQDQLPKVLFCSIPDKKSGMAHEEILMIKKLDTTSQKLHATSVSQEDGSVSEKKIDIACKGMFSTSPTSIALYLSDIVKYCDENPKHMKALLNLDRLSSSEYETIRHNDQTLIQPVTMVERKTEDSLVVVRVEPNGEYKNCQLFEIPLDENMPIEVTIVTDHEDPMYSTLAPPDYRSMFDPKKLKIWAINKCEASQEIQKIFYSSLRSGHEMTGIDLPQRRYEKIKMPQNDPEKDLVMHNVPAIPSSEEQGSFSPPPLLPPKPAEVTSNAFPAKPSPQESSKPGPTSHLDFFNGTLFQQMLQRAVRDTIGGQFGIDRLFSTCTSSDPDSASDNLVSPTGLSHEQSSQDKLSSDDLFIVVSELVDCEGQWYCLGIYLGVPKPKMDLISGTHHGNPKRGLIEVISYWLDNLPNASWSSIVKALYQLEKRNKAREIAEKYEADIPSVESEHFQDSVPMELQEYLTPDEKDQIRRLSKAIEQKSEELQNVKQNTKKHRQKLERFGRDLAEVKRKLKFNEEYTIVLTNGSQITALKMSKLHPTAGSAEQAALASKDKVVYERRIQNVQAETTKLQQQLLGFERECRSISAQQHSLQDKEIRLSQDLMKLEEQLNQIILGGHILVENKESSEQMESPEYYNIIIQNGTVEQKLHQKEISLLQEDLKAKEDQLSILKDKLTKTQKDLVKVEEKIASRYEQECTHYEYDYVAIKKDGDNLVMDENHKTSLQADKVDYSLQIANMHFLRTEVKSQLDISEQKLQKSKKLNQLAQKRIDSRSKDDTIWSRGSGKCIEHSTTTDSQAGSSTYSRVKQTRSLYGSNNRSLPQPRRRVKTDTPPKKTNTMQQQTNGDFRSRTGAVANIKRKKQ